LVKEWEPCRTVYQILRQRRSIITPRTAQNGLSNFSDRWCDEFGSDVAVNGRTKLVLTVSKSRRS